MTFAIFHDFPGLQNGLPEFHDFPWPEGQPETCTTEITAMSLHYCYECIGTHIIAEKCPQLLSSFVGTVNKKTQ